MLAPGTRNLDTKFELVDTKKIIITPVYTFFLPLTMSDWIETPPENRISKDAQIESLDNIVISGYVTINRNVKISLDSPTPSSSSPILSIGKYCYIYPDVEITPSTEKMFIDPMSLLGTRVKLWLKILAIEL